MVYSICLVFGVTHFSCIQDKEVMSVLHLVLHYTAVLALFILVSCKVESNTRGCLGHCIVCWLRQLLPWPADEEIIIILYLVLLYPCCWFPLKCLSGLKQSAMQGAALASVFVIYPLLTWWKQSKMLLKYKLQLPAQN